MTISVNPPKTPVTKGSNGMATATVPNVCKMPGPPAPFVPTPLPNIAQSSDNLDKATKKVKFEGKIVAIKDCTFGSKGDMPSKGTGGGLVSATTHGVAKFVAPGSMNVKAEGKNIQLMGDATTNNNSNPANAATVAELQAAGSVAQIEDALEKIAEECNDSVNEKYNEKEGNPKGTAPSGEDCTKLGTEKHKCCEKAIKDANNPRVHSEVPYDKAGKLMSSAAIEKLKAAADAVYNAVKAVGGATKGVWAAAFFGSGNAPKIKADVVITRPGAVSPTKGNITKVIDFKFNCGEKGKMSKDQKDKYQDVLGKTPEIIHKSW